MTIHLFEPEESPSVDGYPVRLSPGEISGIESVIRRLDPSADICIFGSRADIRKRGGDIDILILSDSLTGTDKRQILLDLHSLLGEQKIDILIAKDATTPFVRLALSQGVHL